MKRNLVCLAVGLVLSFMAAADVNVLIVGSNHDSSEHPRIPESRKAFSPDRIATELRSILLGAGKGAVNVVVEERYTGDTDIAVNVLGTWFTDSVSCYNLASWFHYPYPAGVKAARWSNLRGESGTSWDYVVLIGDPYTIERLPGFYAQGVAEIAAEVAKGSAETILLMPWPGAGSSSSVAHYKEVVYRTGRSGGIKVAPAALAWQAAGSPVDLTHPSKDGAFIAAASIYSSIYGQSASTSTYQYTNTTLADATHTTFVNNDSAPQYSGAFTFQSSLAMYNIKTRSADSVMAPGGASTEGFFEQHCGYAQARCGVSAGAGERYYFGRQCYYDSINGHYSGVAYGNKVFAYPYHSRNQDNDIHTSEFTSQEFTVAVSLMSEFGSLRILPRRLMWAQIHKERPSLSPTPDGQHLSGFANIAVGTYMYTIFSGRCPVDPEPSPVTDEWLAQKIGYETAWRLGRCQTRAPGFKVMPSSAAATTINPTSTETMTVQFIFPPQSNVTVTVTSSDPSVGIVGPQTLLFTPSNYNVPQQVTVKGVPGSPTAAAVDIQFSTTSGDEVYNGLSDSWSYSNTRTATTVSTTDRGTTNVQGYKNTTANISLNAAGASAGNTTFAGPNHGTLTWNGVNVIYTPDTGYVGPDGFAYWTLNGSVLTRGCIDIDVSATYADGAVRLEVADATATEEGRTTGSLNVIRTGSTASPISVNFSSGGIATAVSDYTLSVSSPVTIPAGQSSTQIVLTPVDDTVYGELIETASFSITPGAGYTIVGTPATITIADNDNNAPVANAGNAKTVVLGAAGPKQTTASGGTVTSYALNGTNYTVHTITTVGASTLTFDKDGEVEYLIVGGGGAGGLGLGESGKYGSGGGGAGGLLANLGGAPLPVTAGSHTVTVGGGGAAPSVAGYRGGSGANSSVFGIIANGGGGGAGGSQTAAPGGSGGGGANSGGGAAGTVGQGNNGGNGGTNRGGGGGGAGQVGYNSVVSSTGAGGNGLQNAITGAGVWYAGGGAGNYGPGSLGGGGASGAAGTDGLGAGGGTPAKGGSGIVIVRYIPPSVAVTLTDASVTDANALDTLSQSWTVISHPGTPPIFDNANIVKPTVTFTKIGEYVLRLTASDNYGATGTNEVTITVEPAVPNTPPVVNAGPNQMVLLSASSPWTPAEIAPQAWYDASTATINAVTVSVVNAGSGGGGPISGSASLEANGIGTLQAVGLNGSSQYLTGNYTNTGAALTAFFVGKSSSATQVAWAGMMSVWANGEASDHNKVVSGVLLNQNNVNANSVCSYRNAMLSSATGALTNTFLATTVFNGSTDTLYLNGMASTSVASLGNFNTGKIIVGARWASSAPSVFWNGKFGEAIICNANLSDSDRQKVEGYLTHKWGTTSSLPADHPYKSAAPGAATAVANLMGSASDADGDTLTTTWSVVSPTNSGVTFSNAAITNTTATFTSVGTYVLRLTAADGYGPVYDEVTIAVTDGGAATYAVSYNGNGSTGVPAPTDSSSPYAVGAMVTVLANANLVKTGYTFAGWNTVADGSGTSYAPAATFAMGLANVTLYAQWTANTYTVTFNANGGTAANPASQVVTNGLTYGTLATTSRTGYTFNGWFTAASGGTQVISGTTVAITADQTLYAQWTLEATNTPPVANAQSVTTAQNTAKAITLTGSDVDGDSLTYAIVAQPTNGTLNGTAPTVTYTPAANYNGNDSFTFKVNDGTVDSAAVAVSLTVTAVYTQSVVGLNVASAGATVGTAGAFSLGYTFRVNSPRSVTHLGKVDAKGTGLAVNAMARLYNWDTGVALASAVITPSGPSEQTSGFMSYFTALVTPVSLATNTTYMLAVEANNDFCYGSGIATWASGVTWLSGRATPVGNPAMPATANTSSFSLVRTTDTCYLGPNLKLAVDSSTITMEVPLAEGVYQRDELDIARVPVRGTCGGAFVRAEARAVVQSGYTGVATGWQQIATQRVSGVFSGVLPVQAGGWYNIEVRVFDGAAYSTVAVVQKVGVGDVYITAGQSNAGNYGAPALTPTNSIISAWTGTAWRHAYDPQPIAAGTGGSPWSRLGDLLVAQDGVPVGFVSVAVGSTKVSQWVPGTAYYSRIQDAIASMGATGIRAILWHQGESDSIAGTTTSDYATRLQSIIAQSRVDAGWNVPWGVALASYHPSASAANQAKVRAGQAQVIASDPVVFQGSDTDDYHNLDYLSDTVHFNATGLNQHALAWLTALANMSVTNTPPVVNAGTNRTVLLSGAIPWTPAEIAPQAWYDASTATINAGTVSVVNAGSGGGAISGVASLVAGGIGSLQAVDFNGTTNQFLVGPYTNKVATMTAFFVGQSTSASNLTWNGQLIAWSAAATKDYNNTASAMLLGQYSTSQNSLHTYRVTTMSQSAGAGTNAYVAETVFSGSTNTLYLNGTASAGVASAGSFNTIKIAVGARFNGSVVNGGWFGRFGEVIMFNSSLSVSDRQKVEGYLAHKWGTTSSLPADHPYKSAAPGASGVSVTLNDASVTDADVGDTVSQSWTVVSNPVGSSVSFDNPNSVNATATFTVVGTNVLRLTANDGYGPVSDEVTIVVTDGVVATYAVSYDGNGSTGGTAPTDSSSPYATGATVTVLANANLVKTGYTFAGWNTQALGGGTSYAANDTFPITGNATLYAQWTLVTHTLTIVPASKGTITPGGTVTVADGGSTNFVITPNAHYSISAVTTNGVAVTIPNPAGFTYTWSNVRASGTLSALFQRTRTQTASVPTEWLASAVPPLINDLESAVTQDPDNDGYSTADEYWSGTDPQNSDSFLKLDSVEINGMNVVLKWSHANVDAGLPPIRIQARSNLVSGTWGDIGTQTPTNGVNTWSVGSSVQGYYRLSVTNAP